MLTCKTIFPHSVYPFLESMATLYSTIEKEIHVSLLAGEKTSSIEKCLQNKFQVDSTTVRNVYHNLKGKHSSIIEIKKVRLKELKSTINSIKKSITTQQKRVKTKHKRGEQYRNGTEKPVTHRFVRKDNQWYLHTHVELPDIPGISRRKNGAIGIDLNVDTVAWAYCDREGNRIR